MVTDTKFRLALSILLTALMLLVAKNILSQSLMGHFPLPKIVGTSGAVSLSVAPLITLVDPHKSKEFRVRFRIEPNDDNREYSYFATCGAETKSSIRKIDQTTYTLFEHLTVLKSCTFEVCISRIGLKKPLCARREVPAEGG